MPAASISRTFRTIGVLSTVMKDNIYALRGGRHIYTSPWINERPLKHCSATIGLTTGYKPFEVTIDGSTMLCQAGAVRPMIKRTVRAVDVGLIGFQFDPSHPDFPRFRHIPAPGALPFDRTIFSGFDERFYAAYRGELTVAEASALFDQVAAVAFAYFPKARPIDQRVEHIVALLRKNHNYRLGELAAAVGLSYYRLSHLFAENMGMPLRSYQQWCKVRKAISLSKYGYSLTKIARDAGFADSAHLCRTFRKLHAAPPSYFFNRDYVTIHSPATDADHNALATACTETDGVRHR